MGSLTLRDKVLVAGRVPTSWKHAWTYYFDLIWHLTRRAFCLRYTGSVLGVLWSVLLPLAQLLVLVFLFQKVVPLGIDAYPAFVFSGLLPWMWFSSCLNGASSLFTSNRDLLRRPHFASALLIVVNALSGLLTYVVSLPILFGMLFFYGHGVTPALVTLPLLLLVQSILVIGLSFIIATLNVFYRDVQHLTSVALSLLFYLTPVFYRPDELAISYQILLVVNPMAVLVKSYRAVTFYAQAPEWGLLFLTGGTSIVVCGLGYVIYRSQQHDIVDAL